MSDIKRIMVIAFSYIGAVIGAGFASGQEIMLFFIRFGINGLWGLVMAAFLFMFIGASLLWFVYKKRIYNYQQLICFICGERIGKVLDGIISYFLWGGFAIMLAGSGAVAQEYLGIDQAWGIVLMALIVGIIMMFGIRGVFILNAVLIPCLMIIVLGIGWGVLFKDGWTQNFPVWWGYLANVKETWPGSAILYVGYNLLLALAILASMGEEVKNISIAVGSGIAGGIGLGVLAMVLGMTMMAYFPEIMHCDVPMLMVAQKLGKSVGKIYSLALWIAMLTTAVANVYGLTQRFFGKNKKYKCYGVVLLIVTATPVSFLGFTHLISILYPALGYVGIVFLLFFFKRIISCILQRS